MQQEKLLAQKLHSSCFRAASKVSQTVNQQQRVEIVSSLSLQNSIFQQWYIIPWHDDKQDVPQPSHVQNKIQFFTLYSH